MQQVREKLPDVSIIACGGYATGEGLASAISMGAGAIAMGSRFISSRECEFHDKIKKIVITSKASDTELVTGVFGPMRVWKNKFSARHYLVSDKEEKLAEEDLASEVVEEVKHLEMPYEGNIEDGAVLLGQSIGIIDNIESVSDIINSIVNRAEQCLKDAFNTIM